jgi:uncharacterized protein YjbI with pentapeptide repeats
MADLSRSQIVNFIVSGRKGLSLRGVDLNGIDLSRLDLTNANLSYANLCQAKLNDTVLTGVDFGDADLSEANLTNANLTNANLTNANLTNANLTNANLTNADLTSANLTDADLTEADFTSANLTDAIFDAGGGTYDDYYGDYADEDYEDDYIDVNTNSLIIGESLRVALNDFEETMPWFEATLACTRLGRRWRLPTIEEMELMNNELDKKNYGNSGCYWTSTEDTDGWAFGFDFLENEFFTGMKSDRMKVRAVRTL